jgi:hypothetical protein
MAGKQSAAMTKAQKLITEKGYEAPAAAKSAGVALNSIYVKDWWKAHQKALRAQKGKA